MLSTPENTQVVHQSNGVPVPPSETVAAGRRHALLSHECTRRQTPLSVTRTALAACTSGFQPPGA